MFQNFRNRLVLQLPERCTFVLVVNLETQEPKSPLHGVTRQILVPDDLPVQSDRSSYPESGFHHKAAVKSEAWPLPASGLPRPVPVPRQGKQTDPSVNTSIGNSDFSIEDRLESQRQSDKSDISLWSPMGALSAIPRPLHPEPGDVLESGGNESLNSHKTSHNAGRPSYEGNHYQDEINLDELHATKAEETSADSRSTTPEKVQPKPRSRLPAPILIPSAYQGQLRVASNDTYRNEESPKPKAVPWPGLEDTQPQSIKAASAVPPAYKSKPRVASNDTYRDEESPKPKPKVVPWPGNSPPKPVPWPGFEDSPPQSVKAASAVPPPIPIKSPSRRTRNRGPRSEQLQREETNSHEVAHVVSKANIRAALGDLSRESSEEDLMMHPVNRVKKKPSRIASPPRLQTYNTHMFPRKESRPDMKQDG